MLQRESIVLIREFNRRLRTALRHAPNYMRVEAALEVESHVMDVLSSRTSKLPEAEQVTEILRAFGSPEEYALALMSQMPSVERMSAGSSLREVAFAVSDLVRGFGHLLAAVGRNTFSVAWAVARRLWQASRWAWVRLGRLAAWLRGPLAEGRAWLRLRIRRSRELAVAGGRASLRGMAGAVRLVHAGGRVLLVVLRYALRVLRWTLRAAGIAALGALVLGAFGIALFAAWAPDVSGWLVYQEQRQIAIALEDLRRQTVAGYSPMAQEAWARTGLTVMSTALAAGLVLAGLLGYIIWNGRRRRSRVVG